MTGREEFENWVFINSNWIITQAEKIIRDLDEFGPAEKTYGELKAGDIFILPYSINPYWLDRGVFKMKIILILDIFKENISQDDIWNPLMPRLPDDFVDYPETMAHYYNWTIETSKGVGVAFEEPPPELEVGGMYEREGREEMNYKYVESDKYSIMTMSWWQEDRAQDVLEYVLNVTEGGIIITNINKMPVPFLNWEIDEPWGMKE